MPTNAAEFDNTEAVPVMGRPFEATSAEFTQSAKGIKADWMLVISGGDITVDSTDHAVHCADDIEISGGSLVLRSAYAKGISGHGDVTVNGSDTLIDVQQSTEGLESKSVLTVNGGTIQIIASDDAINSGGSQESAPEDAPPALEQDMAPGGAEPPAADGSHMAQPSEIIPEAGLDPSADFTPPGNMDGTNQAPPPDGGRGGFGGRNPGGMGKSLEDVLIINGGDITVKAGDDCLDANGNIVLSGGMIKASEPSGTIIGAAAIIDADGTVTIGENVTLIGAAGGASAGVAVSQNTVTLYTDQMHNPGDTILLQDASGNLIAEYSPAGSFSTVWIVSPDLLTGGSYTVTAGNETHTFTISAQNTTVGAQTNTITDRPSRDFGGRRRVFPSAENL